MSALPVTLTLPPWLATCWRLVRTPVAERSVTSSRPSAPLASSVAPSCSTRLLWPVWALPALRLIEPPSATLPRSRPSLLSGVSRAVPDTSMRAPSTWMPSVLSPMKWWAWW